jgi:hypothetical protein
MNKPKHTPGPFRKIWFESDKHGQTAGLIVESTWLKDKSTSEVSRLFPYSECLKMERFNVSREYATWDEAFNHVKATGGAE